MVGFQPLGRLGYLLDWIDGGLKTASFAASNINSPALLGSVVEVESVLSLILVSVLVMVGFQPLGRLGYLPDWIDGGLE